MKHPLDQLPVGEVVEYGGKMVVAKISSECHRCVLYNYQGFNTCTIVSCTPSKRHDRKTVIFEEV